MAWRAHGPREKKGAGGVTVSAHAESWCEELESGNALHSRFPPSPPPPPPRPAPLHHTTHTTKAMTASRGPAPPTTQPRPGSAEPGFEAPVAAVLARRARNAAKRLKRVEEIEASAAKGKELNEDQVSEGMNAEERRTGGWWVGAGERQ